MAEQQPKDTSKEFTNGEITIVWRPLRCQFSTNCVKNLRAVFDPHTEPWINIQNGTTEEVIEAVLQCPSGALSYFHNDKKGKR
jgi:uncharacterized Fe-S cluster protein YjdI